MRRPPSWKIQKGANSGPICTQFGTLIDMYKDNVEKHKDNNRKYKHHCQLATRQTSELV